MRLLAFILALLPALAHGQIELLAVSQFSKWSPVTNVGGGSSGGTPNLVMFSNNTPVSSANLIVLSNLDVKAGGAIIVGCGWQDADRKPTLTTDKGDTFYEVFRTNRASGSTWVRLFMATNCAGGTTAITNSFLGTNTSQAGMGIWSLTNVVATDGFHGGTDSSTNCQTQSFTTTSTNGFLVYVENNANGDLGVARAGWTLSGRTSFQVYEHRQTATNGVQVGSCKYTNSVYWSAIAAGFK